MWQYPCLVEPAFLPILTSHSPFSVASCYTSPMLPRPRCMHCFSYGGFFSINIAINHPFGGTHIPGTPPISLGRRRISLQEKDQLLMIVFSDAKQKFVHLCGLTAHADIILHGVTMVITSMWPYIYDYGYMLPSFMHLRRGTKILQDTPSRLPSIS